MSHDHDHDHDHDHTHNEVPNVVDTTPMQEAYQPPLEEILGNFANEVGNLRIQLVEAMGTIAFQNRVIESLKKQLAGANE